MSETNELEALKAMYATYRAACESQNLWPDGFDKWFFALARRTSPTIARLAEQNHAMRHDLETTAGLWAVDHQPVNEPEAFRIEHPSLAVKS